MDKVKRNVEIHGVPIIIPDEIPWKKYRKRPVVISAVQMSVNFEVETLEGWMTGQAGDWLIEGIEGELYPCKDTIFRATYEEVNNEG